MKTMNTELDKHLISKDMQAVLTEEYANKNYAYISAHLGPDIEDSLEYTFSIELLEAYLAYVRQKAAENGVADVNIKICMGQYPQISPDSRIKEDYLGLQTVFLKGYSAAVSGKAEEDVPLENTMGLNFTQITPPPKRK